MKKIVSMLMAMTLILSLSMSIFIPASAIGFEGESSRSIGSSTSNSAAAYVVDKGTMRNIPVKIHAFTNSSKTVRVEVGNSVLTLPVTHRIEGSTWVSTISYTRNNAYVGYGFGAEYDALNGRAVFNITIRHYGNSVATHSLRARANYVVKSKMKLPLLPETAKDNDIYYFTTKNSAHASASGSYGYFSTSFRMSTFDDDSSMRLRCSTIKALQENRSVSHGMNYSSGPAFSGTYSIDIFGTPLGIGATI